MGEGAVGPVSSFETGLQRLAAQRLLGKIRENEQDPLAKWRIPELHEPDIVPPSGPSQPFRAAGKGIYSEATLPARALFSIGGENSINSLLARKFPERTAEIDKILKYEPKTTAEKFGYSAGKLGTEALTLFTPAGMATEAALAARVGRAGVKKIIAKRVAGGMAKDVAETVAQGAASRWGRREVKRIAARTLWGKLAVNATRLGGTFGGADTVHEFLTQQAGNTGLDPLKIGKEGLKGVGMGIALGPASLIGSAAGRILAEAGTMAVTGAAMEGQAPTLSDFVSNTVLFTLMHGVAKAPKAMRAGAQQVDALARGFAYARRDRKMSSVLAEAINAADPEIVDGIGRVLQDRSVADVAAKAFGEVRPETQEALDKARAAMALASTNGDTEGMTAAQHSIDVLMREIERQNSSLAREWSSAVDMARQARGGGPPAVAESPTTPGHVAPFDEAGRRQALTQEAERLEQEAMVGGVAPEQVRAGAARLAAVRTQLEGLPPAEPKIPGIPEEEQYARGQEAIDRTFEAIQAREPQIPREELPAEVPVTPSPEARVQPEVEGPRPLAQIPGMRRKLRERLQRMGVPEEHIRRLNPQQMQDLVDRWHPEEKKFKDMPATIPRELRPEVRRVLAEGGIKGKRRKALMSGPDLWRRAAWEYYKLTGKLPEAGIQAKVMPREEIQAPVESAKTPTVTEKPVGDKNEPEIVPPPEAPTPPRLGPPQAPEIFAKPSKPKPAPAQPPEGDLVVRPLRPVRLPDGGIKWVLGEPEGIPKAPEALPPANSLIEAQERLKRAEKRIRRIRDIVGPKLRIQMTPAEESEHDAAGEEWESAYRALQKLGGKEEGHEPPRGPSQAGTQEGQPHPAPSGRPPEAPSEGPKKPGVSGGVGAREPLGAPGKEPGRAPTGERAGRPAEEPVPGDREHKVLRGNVRLARDQAVELTPSKRKAANAAAEEIIKNKTAEETTEADAEVLRRYTGQGGLKKTEGEGFLWQHYTSYPVVDFVWKKLKALGWKGKTALEPSAGVGTFIGFKPEDVKMDAVELDATSAEIARRLYSDEDVTTGPFELFKGREGGYDLLTGNVPFMEVRGRLRYAPEAQAYKGIETLHDFFVVKGLDLLAPDGVLAYIISTGFMDKADPSVRRLVAEKADLVAAYRLPSGVFEKNTQYEGPVDLVIFRRRGEGEKPGKADWINRVEASDGNKFNEYWDKHPDKVLGVMEAGHGQGHMRQMGVRGEFTPEVEKKVLEAEKGALAKKAAPAEKPVSVTKEPLGGAENTVFTKDEYEKMKAKLRQLAKGTKPVTGLDPEMAEIMLKIGGYHMERLVRAGVAKGQELYKKWADAVKKEIEGLIGSTLSDKRLEWIWSHPSVQQLNERGKEVIPVPKGVSVGQHFLGAPVAHTGKRTLYVATQKGAEPYAGASEHKVRAATQILETLGKIREGMLAGEKTKVAVAQTALRSQLDNWTSAAVGTWKLLKKEPKTKAWFRIDASLNRAMKEDPGLFTLRALIHEDGTYADIASKPTIYTDQYGRKERDFKKFEVAAQEVQRRYGAVDEQSFESLYKGPKVDFEKKMASLSGWNKTAAGWIPDDDYLTGDLKPKIDEAQAAGRTEQLEKLRAVLPPQEAATTYKANLGDAWLDPDMVERFSRSVLKMRLYKVRDRYEKEGTGTSRWEPLFVGGKEFERPDVGLTWPELFQERLNAKIYKPLPPRFDEDGRMTSPGLTLEQATKLNKALELADDIFDEWAKHAEEKDALVERYNTRFRSWRNKVFAETIDGLEGFSNSYFKRIHPWQAKIVNWLFEVGRGINSLGTGGGKTLSFILLSRKLKLEGMSDKPLFVVPAKVINKWVREYLLAFPDAKVLNLSSLTGEAYSPKKRYEMLQRAALNNWDAIVMSYEGFKVVPMSAEATNLWYEQKIQNLENELRDVPKEDRRSERNIRKAIKSLEEKLARALDFDRTTTIDFEKMGVDSLFIDEAHNYKNLPTSSTGLASELGMGGGDAQRAADLDMKTRYILGKNGNRNVFMASAEPTPNAPIEIYTMTSFIAPDVWEAKGITSLHGFLSTFAEVAMKLTSEIGGGLKKQERPVIVGFKNFLDLKALKERFIYKRTSAEMRKEFPDYVYREPGAKYETVFLNPSPAQQEAIGNILKTLRLGPPSGTNPWTWKAALLTKARQASISVALFDPAKYEDYEHPNEKLFAIADRLAENYKEMERNPPPLPEDADPDQPPLNGHAVFLDLYGAGGKRPLKRDLYQHFTDALVARGIPREKIVRVSGSENQKPKQKQQVADDFNAGRYRVVIGSTASMGEGMDLQRIGTHLYHWDGPWNPAAMTQREGRMVRQGNPAEEVHVLRFVTKGTNDQFMYGKLAQKKKWADNLWEQESNYVRNELEEDDADATIEDIEQILDPGEHSRAIYQAKDRFARAQAALQLTESNILEHGDRLTKINAEIAERESKLKGYESRRAEKNEEELFAHAIEQHKTKLADLYPAKVLTEHALKSAKEWKTRDQAELEGATQALREAEAVRDSVEKGANYGTAVISNRFKNAGVALPAGFDAEKLSKAIHSLADSMHKVEPSEALLGDRQRLAKSIENGHADLFWELSPDRINEPENAILKSAWERLYGPLPKIPPRGRQGTGGRSVGAASQEEMARAARRERQWLVSEARRMGIQVGDTIPTPAEVEARSEARVAAATGTKVKKGTRFEQAAVPVPKEGLPLAELEKATIARHGKVDDAKHRLLGRSNIAEAEWEALTRGEKLVHLSRRVMAARDPKHLTNIVSSKKYQVWKLPKDDQAALAVQIGRRMADAGVEAVPPELRAVIARMDAGEMPGVASGKGIHWVPALFPARSALRRSGILEGATGLRSSYEGLKREWNLWMHYGSTELFRDAKGRRMKTGDRNDEVIYRLGDNPEGDELHVERPTVTMGDGTKVVPDERQREVARHLRDIVAEFADRQGLELDRRQKFYMTHLMEKVYSREPATPKDILHIHQHAKKALEGNYDAAAINEIIQPATLKRNKALQIIDMLTGKRPPYSMKTLKPRLDTILGAEEMGGLPTEVYQPFLKERKGGIPYKQSALLMYEAYVRYALRKIHLEPAVNAAKPILEAMQGKGISIGVAMSEREFGERLISRMLGRPGIVDLSLNALTDSLNEATSGRLLKVPIFGKMWENLSRPNLATRAASTLTKIQFLRLLGFAFDSTLTNLTQVVNTWARYGLPKTIAAYAKLLDPRFWKTLREEHLLQEFQSFFAGPTAPWRHPLNLLERIALSPFTAAEFINRGAAFAGALSKAKDQGLSFENATRLGLGEASEFLMGHQFKRAKTLGGFVFGPPVGRQAFYTSPAGIEARKGVIETQFGYSPVESAPMMGTPLGRLAFQFWSYPTQQGAFLMDGLTSSMKNGEHMQFARFLALLGATVTAPVWGPLLGEDLHNLWSIWSVFPSDFGPNAKIAYLLWKAMPSQPRVEETRQELKRELYLPGWGFRYPAKLRKYGAEGAFPIRPIEEKMSAGPRGHRPPRRRSLAYGR